MRVTLRHLKDLRWGCRRSRGYKHPDDYTAFDARIKQCRDAVRAAAQQRKEYEALVLRVIEGATLCAYNVPDEDVVAAYRASCTALLKPLPFSEIT